MTLTHNDDTPWADSATGEQAHGGLTRFGEEVVREMNRLGVLVDCSHVSDDVMRQAIEVSEAPVVFSHSSARALADVPRNVPDDVLEAVGRTGAVVMVTFVPWFVTQRGAEINRGRPGRDAAAPRGAPRRSARGRDARSTSGSASRARWMSRRRTSPTTSTTSGTVAGIDAIGVGGDYDGVPTMGAHLTDVSTYPLVFAELRDRGYTDAELQQIAGRNVLRVMRDAEKVAADCRANVSRRSRRSGTSTRRPRVEDRGVRRRMCARRRRRSGRCA